MTLHNPMLKLLTRKEEFLHFNLFVFFIMHNKTNNVVIVTGASKGLGANICVELAKKNLKLQLYINHQIEKQTKFFNLPEIFSGFVN